MEYIPSSFVLLGALDLLFVQQGRVQEMKVKEVRHILLPTNSVVVVALHHRWLHFSMCFRSRFRCLLFVTYTTTSLEAQAENSKSLAARTVTTASARAFRNASQVSQSLAPNGLLSKLGGSINARFHRSNPSPDGAAAPPTGEGNEGGGGVGGSGAGAAGGAVRPAQNGERRSPSPPQAPASTVVRAGKGAWRRAVSSPAPPSSGPAPRLSERAVNGVLARVFPSRDEAAKNPGVDVGGVDVKASAAEQQAHHQSKKRSGGTDHVVKAVAQKARGWGAKKRAGPPEKETLSPETVASAENRKNNNILSRFGRPNEDAGKSKSASPPPSAGSAANGGVSSRAAGVAQAPNRFSSGGKVGQGRKGSSARDAKITHLSARPVAVADEAVIPEAAARPGVLGASTPKAIAVESTDGVNGKLRGEKNVVAPVNISATPTNSPDQHSLGRGSRRRRRRHRRRRSEEKIEEELRWPDINVAESADRDDSSRVMNGIRARWAKLVGRGPSRADRSDDSTVNAGDDIVKNDDDGGDASSATAAAAAPRRLFRERFRGWFRKGRGGRETGKEDVDDYVLDMVGLGA